MAPVFVVVPLVIGALALTGCATAPTGSTKVPESPSSSQAVWTHLGDSPMGRYFIDFSTIKRQGAIVQFAMKAVHRRPVSISGTTFASHRSTEEVNCRTQERRAVELIFFSGPDLDGAIVKSISSGARPWEKIKPESPASVQFEAVCR